LVVRAEDYIQLLTAPLQLPKMLVNDFSCALP